MSDSKKVTDLRAWGHSKINQQRNYERRMYRQDRKAIVRGNIYNVNLGYNLGHEIDKLRPALVISNQLYNESPNGMATIIPLTKDIVEDENGIPSYDFHFILRKEEFSFLANDSTLELDQIRAVSRKRIDNGWIIGSLDESTLDSIQQKLSSFFL